ncbi:RDD family protein [Aerophototrophica crusticola]|uniref:RDD family protein n=1 Tax=Aerophototrophica crusticola TaxID=1709002 RepID=A0A858R898_9PROT|nr:RDD family protein [Rhodospirillaceae bacterium B3]
MRLGQQAAPGIGRFRVTPADAALDPPYAGFWIRVAAYLVDILVLFVFSSVYMFIGLVAIDLFGGDPVRGPERGILQIVLTALCASYFAIFHSSSWQATVGKKCFGLYVARRDGSQAGLVRCVMRYFATGVSTLTLGIGYLAVAFTAEKTAFHDMLAGTRVYRGIPGE